MIPVWKNFVGTDFFRISPLRLVQYIVVWYCICHLAFVIPLNAAGFIRK